MKNLKERVINYIRSVYEGDRNNGVFEQYFHQYDTQHQMALYNGKTIYLEIVDGQVEMAYDEKDFFYKVILNDDTFIELVANDTPIEVIEEYEQD